MVWVFSLFSYDFSLLFCNIWECKKLRNANHYRIMPIEKCCLRKVGCTQCFVVAKATLGFSLLKSPSDEFPKELKILPGHPSKQHRCSWSNQCCLKVLKCTFHFENPQLIHINRTWSVYTNHASYLLQQNIEARSNIPLGKT